MAYKKEYSLDFKIHKHETLAFNFLRLITGMNERAWSLCRFRSIKDADAFIHEIRKSLKRARAVLKLFRPSIGDEIYIDQNTLYRDIGRQLGQLRSSAVRVITMNNLIDSGKLAGDISYSHELVHKLQKDHDELRREVIMRHKLHRSVSSMLRGNRRTIKSIPEFSCEFSMVAAGLKKMYRRSTVNLNAAMNQPSAVSVHNFRKPVKFLWNQMILLRPVWSPAMGQIIRCLDLLGDRLGMEHDLAELEQYLWTKYHADASAIEPVILLIRKERKRIQHNVWPLSLKVFAESPEAFARRISAYWDLWL